MSYPAVCLMRAGRWAATALFLAVVVSGVSLAISGPVSAADRSVSSTRRREQLCQVAGKYSCRSVHSA